MSPPKQEGDRAMSNQNGFNPSSRIPENSIEREVLQRTDRESRLSLLKSVILTYSGENVINIDIDSPTGLKAFQNGVRNILIEHDRFLQISKGDIWGLTERKQYLNEVLTYYFSIVFLQPYTPNLKELDFELLNNCIKRFKDDTEPKKFSDICVHLKLDDPTKAAYFLRLAFSANVDNTLRKSAKSLLDAISKKCEQSGSKSKMVISLSIAKNTFEQIKGVSGGIIELIESWLKGS